MTLEQERLVARIREYLSVNTTPIYMGKLARKLNVSDMKLTAAVNNMRDIAEEDDGRIFLLKGEK